MLKNAVVTYLDDSNSGKNSAKIEDISSRLSCALKRFRKNSDLKVLQSSLSRYLGTEDALEKNSINKNTLVNSFSTFNLAPSNSYDRYLSVINNISDCDAIRSDWQAVGEDLSFSYIKYMLGNK